MVTVEDIGSHELELLQAALADVHATVRTNDAKNPPALIVHGLLFAGTTSVVSRLGDLWHDAPLGARIVIVGGLACSLVALVVSVICLLLAIRPRTRIPIADELRGSSRAVLFPAPQALAAEAQERLGRAGGVEQLAVLRERAAGVGATELRDACLVEILKLSHLHAFKARLTGIGITALIVEIVGVGVALGLIGAVALTG